ncbi:hypothetical protein JCM8097_008069 [Rhodosporidiobolus ruineniae]
MAGRARFARKAASTVDYTSKAYDALGSSEEDDEGQELMRTRRKRKGVGRGKGRTVYLESTDSDEEVAPKKRSRKRKPAAPKGSKKQSKKDYLRLLPTEILCEILSYFHPGELLSFRLTSKTNFALLSFKSSAPIWRKSRQRMQLDDVEGISEIRYAQLAFGKTCEMCNGKQDVRTNWDFQLVSCRQCRNDHYVKMRDFKKKHSEFHPLTPELVVLSDDSPAGWGALERYALRSDLQRFSDKLFDLEIADHSDPVLTKLATAAEDTAVTTRVDRFVVERNGALEAAQKARSTPEEDLVFLRVLTFGARPQLAQQLKSTTAFLWPKLNRERDRLAREQERLKLASKGESLEHDSDWTSGDCQDHYVYRWQDFWQKEWQKSKYARRAQLSDNDYEQIKPQALKVAQRALAAYEAKEKKAKEARDHRAVKEARLEQIRSRFDNLRAAESDEQTRLLYPVFPVFLTFNSVKPLLPPEKLPEDFDPELTDEVWDEALPLIKEELEQYRLDLFLHAIKLILRATTDDELPEDDDLLANLEQYDDAFFAKATSFLCCTAPDCFRYRRSKGAPPAGRITFIGPLFSLLKHQHEAHSSALKPLKPSKNMDGRLAVIPLDLPLEVACAVSALIDLGDLDDSTAGTRELNEMDREGSYEWEDSTIWSKWFDSWRDLLDAVYRAAVKAARAGPDHCLPLPTIVYRKNRPQAEVPQLFPVLASTHPSETDDSTDEEDGRDEDENADEDSEEE